MIYRTPRFMTDAELGQHFGLPEHSLRTLRKAKGFPPKYPEIGKTDSRAVDNFFDIASQLPVAGEVRDPPVADF